MFFDAINPIHKNEVIRYLFAKSLKKNFLLKNCKMFNEQLLYGFQLEITKPEEVVI
jgi:hypothetical protein